MAALSGTIPERTLRSWLDGTSPPDEQRLSDFSMRGRLWLREHLVTLAWSDEVAESYLQEIKANTGVLSAMVHVVHWRGDKGCPAALTLSRLIDALSTSMAERRKVGDIAGFARLFFDTAWLSDAHFNYPGNGLDAASFRANSLRATTWDELMLPAAVLLVHLQLQLLATLDHEFSAQYLASFTQVPVFLGLFPKRIQSSTGGPRVRGGELLPVRRLLHMLACMRYFKKHGKWPLTAPSVEDTAKWMDVLPGDLAKWRMGRRFIVDDFDRIWDRMFEDFAEAGRPGNPIPLMFAAVVLTRMFVSGQRERGDLSLFAGADSLYTGWWEHQRIVANARFPGARTGTGLWMPELL